MNFLFNQVDNNLEPLLSVMQRMGCGAVFIDANRNILSYNPAAASIICSYSSEATCDDNAIKRGIKHLLNSSDIRFVMDRESWAIVSRPGMRPIAVHALPSGNTSDIYKTTLIVIIDLDDDRTPKAEALQKMFNLTPSEANVAIQISKGRTPTEIAKENGTTLWTVRSQLASIFSKTQTKRQSDLVSLMLKISMIS